MEQKPETAVVATDTEETTALAVNTKDLDKDSLEILNQIIAEPDINKTKDLTTLFNVNQTKKTLVRVNKLGNLLDTLTDQAMVRFTTRPDEISNKELIDGMKVIQDLMERGQTQASSEPTTLIQFNQQNNEVHVEGDPTALNRDSRERVKNAVSSLLASLVKPGAIDQPVEAVPEEETEVAENIITIEGDENDD